MTPTLASENLTLRLLTKVTARHVSWLNDLETMQFSEQRHEVHTNNSVQKYINGFNPPSHIWGIYRVSDNQHVGNITAYVDKYNNFAEIGILLGKDYWRAGFGTEAWLSVCSWMLDKDGGNIRKLSAGFRADNTFMRRVLEKTGFQFDGELKNHFLIGSTPIGIKFYSRFQ